MNILSSFNAQTTSRRANLWWGKPTQPRVVGSDSGGVSKHFYDTDKLCWPTRLLFLSNPTIMIIMLKWYVRSLSLQRRVLDPTSFSTFGQTRNFDINLPTAGWTMGALEVVTMTMKKVSAKPKRSVCCKHRVRTGHINIQQSNSNHNYSYC